MKRISNEQINTFVRDLLKRRNYSDNSIQKINRKQNKMKNNDNTKGNQSLPEVALNGSLVNSSSDSDVICLSQSIGDFAYLAENAFKSFIEFVSKHKSKQRLFEQLSQIEFPIFLHIFIELSECGSKISARRFLKDHKTRFKESSELQIIDSMNKSLSISVESMDSLRNYRLNKYLVKISEKCLETLKKYLKENNDLVIIQIINNFIDFNLYSTHNSSESEKKLELVHNILNKNSQYNELDLDIMPSGLSSLQSSAKDTEILKNSIERVRNSEPCLPPICLYTIISSNLNCVSVTEDMVSIAMGFDNSNIYLKTFEQNVLNSESSLDIKRISSQIKLNFIDHTIEDDDEDNQTVNSDNCDNNDSTDEYSYKSLRGHSGPVYDLTFVPRTNLLLSCSCDTTVRAWDTTTGHNVAIFDSHLCPVWTIDSSFLGNYFCTGCKDSTAYLWSLDRNYPLRTFCGHNMSVDCVRFHPNSNLLATASADKEIKLWDIQEARAVRTLVGHKAPIYCLSFSSCGYYLASAGEDRKVRIWDLKSGDLLKELSGHTDCVYSVCFNHNNTVLSSCGADQSLRLWNLNNITNKSLVMDSNSVQNSFGSDSDQLMSYKMDTNVIHSQFMPKNLLLSIATKMPSN